jgi:uncharacterized membrane protein YbhN (UPF0104 family)
MLLKRELCNGNGVLTWEPKKCTARQVLKITIAVALVGILFSQISAQSLSGLWNRVSIPWFFVSTFAFYATIWCMARRYWILIGRKIPFFEMLKVVSYQTIMANFVATGAGAVFYMGLLRARYNIKVGEGLLSMVLARVGDVVALFVALVFASCLVWERIRPLHFAIIIIVSCMTTLAFCLLLIMAFRRRFSIIAGDFEDKFPRLLVRWISDSLQLLSQQGIVSNKIGQLAAYSVLTFGMMLLFAYCSLRTFEFGIDIWPVVFVVSLTQIIALLPLQVFGGLGLFDISYLYLYGLFGYDHSEFAPIIVGLRICFYLSNLAVVPLVWTNVVLQPRIT